MPFKCQQTVLWTLYCYNRHVVITGIHPSLANRCIQFHRLRYTSMNWLWMIIDFTLYRGLQKACYTLRMFTCMNSAHYSQFSLSWMYHCAAQWNTQCILFLFLVACTHVELLLIFAICVLSQGLVFCQILPAPSYASWGRTAPARMTVICCTRYGGMLKSRTVADRPSAF